jgi:hypothetical protein
MLKNLMIIQKFVWLLIQFVLDERSNFSDVVAQRRPDPNPWFFLLTLFF